MLEKVEQLLNEKKIVILVGNSGTGKTFITYQLINTYSQEKVNLIFNVSNANFKEYCADARNVEFKMLEDLTNFSLNKYQLIDTQSYGFEGKGCPSIIEALQALDKQLTHNKQEAVLYLDDCPLQLHQEVIDYLIENSFVRIKVVVTCIYASDIKGIENFAQIKLDRNRYV